MNVISLPKRAASGALDFLLTRQIVRRLVKQHALPKAVKAEPAGDDGRTAPAAGLRESDLIDQTKEALSQLARSQQRIVVGPWVSEVSVELLYWIPFVRWAQTEAKLDPEQLVVVSRGGAAPWYRHITDNYRDVLERFTPDNLRSRSRARVQKNKRVHRKISDFDQEVIRALGLEKTTLLHPSLMYNLFEPFWRQQASISLLDSCTAYQTFVPPDGDDVTSELPAEYVAVKFYSSPPFPNTETNQAFVSSLLRKLTERSHVVQLDAGIRIDEHDDIKPPKLDRLHTLSHVMDPRVNLEIQSKVISRARAFVGTYGGFSYLAPFYNVGSLAIYSERGKSRPLHLDVATRGFTTLRGGAFVPLDVRDVNAVCSLLDAGGAHPGGPHMGNDSPS